MSFFATFDPKRIERYQARKRQYQFKDRLYSAMLVSGWIAILGGLCFLLCQSLMNLVG